MCWFMKNVLHWIAVPILYSYVKVLCYQAYGLEQFNVLIKSDPESDEAIEVCRHVHWR